MRVRLRPTAIIATAAAMLLATLAAAPPAAPRSLPPPEEGLSVMSDEEYAAAYGQDRARAAGLAAESPTAALSPQGPPAARGSHWSVVKFVSTDGEKKPVPTREGNSAFGWQHFSEPHNIHDPKVIKIVTSEHPVKQGARREYGGVLTNVSARSSRASRSSSSMTTRPRTACTHFRTEAGRSAPSRPTVNGCRATGARTR